MPATFEQTFLKPGRYHIGGGVYRDITAADIAAYVSGTKEMLRHGNAVPVLFEHASPGSPDGAPVQLAVSGVEAQRAAKANQVKHGAGWLKDVKVGTDGAALHVLEITNGDAAKGMLDGSIKFTSPELRRSWTDGRGKRFENVISHVALTHKPRAADQGPLVPVTAGEPEALQFSLADFEEIQMADDETPKDGDGDGDGKFGEGDKAPDAVETPKANPDAPNTGTDDQKFEAILAHLGELGLPLPSDTDNSNFFDRLLTALLVNASAKEKADADAKKDAAADDPGNPDADLVEEKSPMQFSVGDAEGGKITNKLLAKHIVRQVKDMTGVADEMVTRMAITPAARQKLTDLAGTVQFSADGDEQPCVKLSDVLGILKDTLPEGLHVSAEAVAQFAVEDHPRGDEFLSNTGPDEDPGPEKAKAAVDKQLAENPAMAALMKR